MAKGLLGTAAVFTLDTFMTIFIFVFFLSYINLHAFFVLSEKPPRRFSCQMKLNKKFQPLYKEISSPETLALISELNRIFVPFFKKRFENFLEIIYKRFFQGSIGMDFDIIFQPTSNVSNSSIVEALEEGNGTTQLAFVVIIGDITVTEQLPVTQATVQSPPAEPTGILLVFFIAISVYCFSQNVSGKTRLYITMFFPAIIISNEVSRSTPQSFLLELCSPNFKTCIPFQTKTCDFHTLCGRNENSIPHF